MTSLYIVTVFTLGLLKTTIATRYIIQLSEKTSLSQFIFDNSLQTLFNLETVELSDHFKAFVADINETYIEKLYHDPKVAAISIDRSLELCKHQVQKKAPDHLSVLNNQRLSSVKVKSSVSTFEYDIKTGNGVDIYILDSGIDSGHPVFASRKILKLADLTAKPILTGDTLGHGTAIAGLISSEPFGVTKKANLVDVRVVEPETDTATLSAILMAFSIIKAHVEKSSRPSVIVLPFTTARNSIFNSAIENMPYYIPIVVPAGNHNKDACSFSPQNAKKCKNMLTVGSLKYYNSANGLKPALAEFSNHGLCVDIYTSGVALETAASTSNSGKDYLTTLSGTSASCAIGAGVLSYYMSLGYTGLEAISKIKSLDLKNISGRSIRELKLI